MLQTDFKSEGKDEQVLRMDEKNNNGGNHLTNEIKEILASICSNSLCLIRRYNDNQFILHQLASLAHNIPIFTFKSDDRSFKYWLKSELSFFLTRIEGNPLEGKILEVLDLSRLGINLTEIRRSYNAIRS